MNEEKRGKKERKIGEKEERGERKRGIKSKK